MNRRLALGAAASAFLVLVAGGIVAYRVTAPPDKVIMDVSWAQSYNSLHDLRQNSDVAAAGHMTKIVSTTVDNKGVPYTDFELTVDSVVHSSDPTVTTGSKLIVHQTGGTQDGAIHEALDDPLFSVGEHVVLFLRRYAPGRYYVIGGPTGRFHVDPKSDAVTPSGPSGVTFSGTLPAFKKAVDGA